MAIRSATSGSCSRGTASRSCGRAGRSASIVEPASWLPRKISRRDSARRSRHVRSGKSWMVRSERGPCPRNQVLWGEASEGAVEAPSECLDGVCLDRFAKADLAALGVDDHRVALDEIPAEELKRQRILDQALHGALQRPRSIHRVVALLGQYFLRRRCQLERDALVG